MTDESCVFPRLTWPQGPDYPRRDGRPLTGWRRARFVLALWRHGYRTVQRFQRAAQIQVDGLVGVQTWLALWAAQSS